MPSDIKECEHPPAYCHLTDAGLTISCGACGVRRKISREMMRTLMAPKAGDQQPMATEVLGPTAGDLAMIAARQDFALRAMGRAFWRGDHNREQQDALKTALDVKEAFAKLRPGMKTALDILIAKYPGLEYIDRGGNFADSE